jgi:hypothetical protein
MGIVGIGIGMGIEVAMLGNEISRERGKVLVVVVAAVVDLDKARVGDQLHGVL